MDISYAKEFLLLPLDNDIDNNIYISKDLQTLIDKNGDNDLNGIYAVIDTASGETLMEMDRAYSGEPLIMRRLIHKDYFLKHYHYKPIKIL